MYVPQLRRIAKALGVRLAMRRHFDVETAEGILHISHREGDHVAFLKAGLVFETDGTVWEPDVYRIYQGTEKDPAMFNALLVVVGN